MEATTPRRWDFMAGNVADYNIHCKMGFSFVLTIHLDQVPI